LIKEEISVYFRMVLGRGVAGKELPRMDGKRKRPVLWAVAAREGRSTLPEKAWKRPETSVSRN